MDKLFQEGLVQRNSLSFIETRAHRRLVAVSLQGHIECRDRVVLFVDKNMEVRRDTRGRDLVRTVDYGYHARLMSRRLDLFRYDSAHGSLHRHDFDVRTGVELGTRAIERDELPTLDGIVREAIDIADRIAEQPDAGLLSD
jgi:hypothetical protein